MLAATVLTVAGAHLVQAQAAAHRPDSTTTHAAKKAELKKLEQNGYQPSAPDPHYPQDIQNAEKKAAGAVRCERREPRRGTNPRNKSTLHDDRDLINGGTHCDGSPYQCHLSIRRWQEHEFVRPSASGKSNWKPAANPWLIAIVVTLAAFMEVLDTTIVNVALPHIAGTMSASYDEATWTLTSYLVANGIVLPISGFLGRLLGRKRYFLVCIVAFTICSFLCGIATDLWQLIVFRILQGFFGGGLQPNQQSIILDTFPPEQRGRAFSISAVAIVVAPVLGPTLGGWITDNFSWRWVFLLNVPVGVLTTLAVMQLVEDPPGKKKGDSKVSVDYIGITLIAIGLGCLQVMLDRGEDDDWFSSKFIRTFAVLAVAGIVGAVFWLLYTKKPVVDLRCLKDRNFALGCMTIGAFATILYGSAVLVPQLAQQQLGYTAMLAGLVLSPGPC